MIMRERRAEVKILAISDTELPHMQNVPYLHRKYSDVDVLISCGDLSAAYIEFISSVLCVPMYYVRGNHDTGYALRPPGGVDLHGRLVKFRNLWMAGLEGSRRYNQGPIQYDESEMLLNVLKLAPGMLLRRARRHNGVDLMVTHASPWGIHDRDDLPHRGFRSFHLLIRWYRPRYFIHGHVDVWDRRDTIATTLLETQILNINPVYLLTLAVPPSPGDRSPNGQC